MGGSKPIKQYCRYCNSLVAGNGIYCTERNKELSEAYAKSVNTCKYFELNPIDAFGENNKGYTPRKEKQANADGFGSQLTLDIEQGGTE